MENTYKVDTSLGMFEYIAIVNDIADEYFDPETGAYQPHIGLVNAMRIFYNNCVLSCSFDDKYGHNVTSATAMADIVKDHYFIEEFDKAVRGVECSNKFELNFSRAYADAMDIVGVDKGSISKLIKSFGVMMKKIADDISPYFTDENFNAVLDIAKNISSGDITADQLINAYADKLEGLKKE